MSSCTGQISVHHNLVFISDGLPVEVAFKNLTHTVRVTGLGAEGGTRNMRGHGLVGHIPPGVVGWWGLGEPNITGVSSKLTRFKGRGDVIAVANLATGGVHNVCSAFHGIDQFG